jgi:hypothetical protein
MNWVVTAYIAILFFVLTPGVLLSLPPKSSKFVVAATHAVVFALVYHFTHKMVWRASVSREGVVTMTGTGSTTGTGKKTSSTQ